MQCPFCLTADSRVIDSRTVSEGNKIRRRRECQNPECSARFTTYEVAESYHPTVIKQNGEREPFSAEKLRRGLLRACEKRPVAIEAINQLTEDIEIRIKKREGREIPTQKIGQWVMEGLKNLDHVAYIRFASVYLSFADIAAFQKTIDELGKNDK